MEQWNRKVAIVTGASSGIGEATVKALVKRGVRVVALARREDKLKKLTDGLNGSIYSICCDVRKEKDILRAFQFAESQFGGVDILINNAGIAVAEPITDGKTQNFQAILEVNVLAPAIATREAVRSMRKRGGGHIININSTLGRNPLLMPTPMSLLQASKAALDAMTANVRQEVKTNKDNIKVTGIYPGLVKTEAIAAGGLDPEKVFQMPHVQPEDIAESVVFALSAPGNVQIDDITVTPLHG